MALILSLETSTDNCSVALHREGVLISLKEWGERGGHASKLPGLVDEVMEEVEIQAENLQAVAVSEGPGSYTGLRIGVSTAKGLAYALGLPLIGINTLQSLAIQVSNPEEGSIIISQIDARRMEVYAQVFDKNGDPLSEISPEILDNESYGEFLAEQKVYFIGNAVEKMSATLSSSNAVFIEGEFSAKWIGPLAYRKFTENKFEDVAYFVPNYLKEFQALHSRKNPLLS
ncbi:tRNA (adenosine(37)-N6)-threonylcarbamoyltransferase complex dimerization subunit type 1 TsaB [Algoriphagus hitonicola]|uniref:tRNA threonylcarbamoyladenosine biosynthesis protein TsaB n=1 Tax=Algoriphagus hitonicola TaxID=435880 RepID=A0A1I2XLU6_9BACT|nr:tRNA (adenosine(37)-N6)-threonylcarbamoyltransferase complex dimerization subunit type 1 TsaB [Algoriphagus hitonicola]SFH14473.1 tRNA threonylcarbamoyladenosine biosynthesis protein TsaB [Algoriphagus hitonicola]